MFISRKQSSEAFLLTKMEKNKDTGFRTKMEKKMEMFSSRNGASERSFRDENMENKMDTDLITKREKKLNILNLKKIPSLQLPLVVKL